MSNGRNGSWIAENWRRRNVWKSKSQLRYEAELRERKRQLRARGIAHPAAPTGYDGLWLTECQREGCSRTFQTAARQRKYCSQKCQRLDEDARAKRLSMREALATVVCGAEGCQNRFLPKRLGHRYCSTACRKAGYRQGSNLRSNECAQCGASLAGKKVGARYCGDSCRKRASRKRKGEASC